MDRGITKKELIGEIFGELKEINVKFLESLPSELEKINKDELFSLRDLISNLIENRIPALEDDVKREYEETNKGQEDEIDDEVFEGGEKKDDEEKEAKGRNIKTDLNESNASSNEKIKPLSSSTPVYSGSVDEDLEKWIFIINQNFFLSNIKTDLEKLRAISNFLKGTPMKSLRSYMMQTTRPKINELFQILKRMVSEEARIDSLKNRLQDLTQGENFSEFLKRFQTLALQLQSRDISWADKKTIFAF